MSQSHKGKVYIHKGDESKRVFPSELEQYLSSGWTKGMVPRTKQKNDQIQKKCKMTNLEKYGCEYAMQNKDVKQKVKQTCLIKYGATSVLGSNIIQCKIKQTCLEKYGVEYQIGSKQTQQKIQQTCQNKYGVNYPLQSELVRNKGIQTCMDKYGVINPFQMPEVIEKCNTPESIAKGFQTKLKNGTTNTSEYEDKYYDELISIYGIENIKRNYIDKLRYPFHCDFYILSEDKFIELNLFWTHGGHPYNADNELDKQILNQWILKADESEFFKNAIYTWTISDPKKLEIARQNNLNYIRLYFTEERNYKIYDLWD